MLFTHTWMYSVSPHFSLYNQVERFGKPTWRRLVEAVKDPVGGNNHALAQKIAAEHPGMQPYTNTGVGGVAEENHFGPQCIRTMRMLATTN